MLDKFRYSMLIESIVNQIAIGNYETRFSLIVICFTQIEFQTSECKQKGVPFTSNVLRCGARTQHL